MRGCSVHYHETLDLTDSVDVKLIDPPSIALRSYRDDDLVELVTSIREKGLIQPILIRPIGSKFEVVAGARRLEACKRLRWGRVPCIIKELSNQDAYEVALTENLQRRTMNAIEEALAFRKYIEQNGWGGETELAAKIGKSQEYISQRLTLLKLPRTVQTKIIRRQINPSVAQEIARIDGLKTQEVLGAAAVKRRLTVDAIRETVGEIKKGRTVRSALKTAEEKRLTKNSDKIEFEEDYTVRSEIFEPDFTRKFSDDKFSPSRAALRDLEKSILILRLALSRLGSLIDEIPEESPVKDLLLEKRLVVHNIIDSLIKSKIKLNSNSIVAEP